MYSGSGFIRSGLTFDGSLTAILCMDKLRLNRACIGQINIKCTEVTY